MLGPRLEVAQRTDPGRDPNKQDNEDASGYQLTRLGHLLVVCDGMGGHALGQEASQLALRTIVQMVDGAPTGTPPGSALRGAIAQAGRLVYQMGGSGPQAGRPGSTCVAALVHAGGAEIAHVGDSRAYILRRGQIWQLTKDHSVVQQMIDLGALTPQQAAAHPEANKITRALGMRPETDVELRDSPVPYDPEDIFVLATDGLSDLVGTEEIAGIVSRAPSLDAATEELVRCANARGGHDNITVQLARVAAAEILPARTVVDAGIIVAPEKTVIDHAPTGGAERLPPTLPHGVAVVPPSPAVPPPVVPLPVAPPPVLPLPPAILPTPTRTHPGPPSRSGVLVLALGFTAVGLILAGVIVWWLLRGPR